MNKTLNDLGKKLEATKKALASKKNGGMQRIEEIMRSFSSKKDHSIKRLEELRRQFLEEIDANLDGLYQKRDDLAEAFKKRFQLKKHRRSFLKMLIHPNLKYIVSMPLIYGMILPGIVMHFCLELYHQICFRLYGMQRVDPRKFFIIDRQHLAYLNWFEKINCMYCGYFNGLMGYGREIASLSELYWCPIKHAQKLERAHEQYHHFVEYVEGEEYRAKFNELRALTQKEVCIPGKQPKK